MRHGKKVNHLSRKTAHRKALLSNMSNSLILHKRIKTTLAKAKALRIYVEPLITRSKENTTHNRRMCFRYLQDKFAVTELFEVVSPKIGERPGGYTRIIRIGTRAGDNAEMCLIELVDFNEIYNNSKSEGTSTTKKRKSRRGGAKKAAGTAAAATVAASATAENVVEEEIIEEVITTEGIDPELAKMQAKSDEEE